MQKNCHLCTIAQLYRAVSSQIRHMSTIGKKNLLNTNISSTGSHNMVNIGPLMAEIGLGVWGTPANFSGFRILASLLHLRRLTEVNQTFHDIWPFSGLLHYIYIWGEGGLLLITEFCPVQNSLCVEVLCYLILSALLHGTSAVGIRQTLRHGIFHATGRPSRSTLGS